MSRVVQSRLDDETDSLRSRLQKQLGWSNSEIVRRGIQLLASTIPKPGEPRFSGIGKYDSGISDLATNKAHMEGFGE
jgi:hypothetical protein